MKSYLEDLELNIEEEKGIVLVVTPPSFRGDLEREIDLIEEIARMDGYENIPITLPSSSSFPEGKNRDYLLERKAMEVLIHHGFHEVITYSFVSPACQDLIGPHARGPEEKASSYS